MLTVKRFLLVAAAGLILAGAMAYSLPWSASSGASAAGGGAEMRLVVKEGGACDGDTCVVPLGASFTLSVDVAPPQDYVTVNSFIVYGADLTYNPTDTVGDEFVWPECGPAILPVRAQLDAVPNSVLHSCASGLLPPFPLRPTGNFIDLSITCSTAESSTLVELLQQGEDPAGDSGSLFKLSDQSEVIPKTTDLTVICGSGAPPHVTATPTNSPTPDLGNAEMRLVVKKGGACDGDTCVVPLGASFTLAVEVVGFPEGGYILAQTYIDMGSDLVYKPADAPDVEFVWPDCVTSVALRNNLRDAQWLHSCITGLIPPLPASTYTGNLLELKLNCSEDDTSTEVRLIPTSPQLINGGTSFGGPDGVRTVPKTSNITVICGSVNSPTNTPSHTGTPVPPTFTPLPPTSTPVLFGDANCDGVVDAIDASLVLQLEAGLISALPCEEKADVNGDGLLNSLDAVLILQFAADLIPQLPAGNTR
ncbi:MAG: dockerin type I repeat-containing protein [Chloroflexi bacterium]|nr:dockerin type I repeat-containing protein [Chloroflexota bacterium]